MLVKFFCLSFWYHSCIKYLGVIMTAFLKDKAVGQADEILANGKRFSEAQPKEILKDVVPWTKKEIKDRSS
jgi:hypothetical protein